MSFTDDLFTIAQEAMEEWSVPGLAIGTYAAGSIETWTLGVTALDTGFPIREDTLFQIGSISKPFTATLLLRLVDEGLVDLDAPVTEYVPYLKLGDLEMPGRITTRHLLTHQAGFWGDWFDDFGLADDAIERFVGEYGRLPQLFEPGTMWAYNNCGYILAGLIAARVSGHTFEAAMQVRLLDPLDLDHTVLSAAEAIAYPVAVGHTVNPNTGEVEIARQFLRPRARNPAGGVLSTIRDVLTFAALHLEPDGSIMSPDIIAAMRQPLVETFESGASWGLGFKIEEYGGARIVGHGGATNGFRALLLMAPESNFAVAALTNGDNGNQAAGTLCDWILTRRLGISSPELETVEVNAGERARMAGRYEQPYASLEIRERGDALEARFTTQSPYSERTEEQVGEWIALRPIGDQRYECTSGDVKGSQLKFWLKGSGDVKFLQAGGRLYVPGSWDGVMGGSE